MASRTDNVFINHTNSFIYIPLH